MTAWYEFNIKSAEFPYLCQSLYYWLSANNSCPAFPYYHIIIILAPRTLLIYLSRRLLCYLFKTILFVPSQVCYCFFHQF